MEYSALCGAVVYEDLRTAGKCSARAVYCGAGFRSTAAERAVEVIYGAVVLIYGTAGADVDVLRFSLCADVQSLHRAAPPPRVLREFTATVVRPVTATGRMAETPVPGK